MTTPAPAPIPRLGRRPLLDGLRGVFVGLTVLFHLESTGRHLPGGWVGVSGFFVLSGFLITRLLLAEHAVTGGVDLKAFYARRARRLAPVLLVVVAGTVVATAARSTPLDPARVRDDALGAVGYVANWRFVLAGDEYGATFAPSPLRHTWSLAIEEQFYLVWPLLLVALARVVSRRRLLVVLALGAVTSAWWAGHLAATGATLTRVYDGTDTRAQELLVGGALAVLLLALGPAADGPGGAAQRRRSATFAGFCGLGLLGLAAVRLPAGDPATWERGRVLAVAVAAALVVGGAALTDRGPLGKVLGGRFLLALGARSYTLYLVHWPVVVLLDGSRTDLPAPALDALRLVVALGLTEVLHRFVERPFLEGRVRIARPGRTLVGGMAVVALLAVALTLTPRATEAEASPLTAAPEVVTLPPPPPPVSGFAPPPRVVVLGDSQAFGYLENAPTDPGIVVGGSHHGGCDIVGRVIASADWTLAEVPDCPAWPDEWRLALQDGADAVVVVLGLRQIFDEVVDGNRVPLGSAAWDARYRDGIDRAVGVIRERTDAPVVWLDVACSAWYFDRERSGRDPDRLALVNGVLADQLATHADITVAPFGERVCHGAEPDLALRPDGVHLTDAATAAEWPWLRAQIALAIAPPTPPTDVRADAALRADLLASNLG